MRNELQVTQWVVVTVDESKFTPEFMEEFRHDFFNFQTIDDHTSYLGKLFATGQISEFDSFIEGYGPPTDFGIKFEWQGVSVSAC